MTERDRWYYFLDGNTTFLVENIIFKVHRSLLARDGSTFENMFSLDLHSKTSATKDGSHILVEEGGNDLDPIQLHGDTADEFRDLLWSLYALPQEITQTSSSEADVIRFSNIAQMAHKYHFITTESWALKSLSRCLMEAARSGQPISTHALVRVTEVAVLCNDSDSSGNSSSTSESDSAALLLLTAVVARWRSLIAERKDLAVVMGAAGRLQLRDLEGLAYHAMLLQGRRKWDADPLLTRDQRVRLLSGHYNLTVACEAMPDSPPEINHHLTCSYRGECQEVWEMLWKQITSIGGEGGISSQALVHDKLDLLGRAMMAVSVMTAFVEGSIPQYELITMMHGDCTVAALGATSALCHNIRETLIDYFDDVK